MQKEKLAIKKALTFDLDFGLDWLESWVLKDTDAYNEVLLHRSNYQSVKNDLRKQLLDTNTATPRITAVRYSLMNWIDQVEEMELNPEFNHTNFLEQLRQKEKETDSGIEPIFFLKRKWVRGVLIISMLGVIAFWGYNQGKSKANFLTTTFDLNIIVYGDSAKSNIIRNGTLHILQNGKPEPLTIGQDGSVVWRSLLNEYRNTEFYVNPQVSDYQSEQLVLQIPAKGNVLDVILQPINYQTKVLGNVLYKGKPGKNLMVDIQGFETKTDEKGDFEKVVPYKKGTEVRIRIFENNIEIHNSTQRITSLRIPLTIKKKK